MENQELIIKIIKENLLFFGFDGEVSLVREDGGRLRAMINTDSDVGMLIGKGGDTLRALQHILLLVVSKKSGYNFAPGEFIFDINDYQKERENYLISLAKNTAYQVMENKRAMELQPMPPSERRIVHITLDSYRGVITESVGDRAERKVVVRPT